MELRENVSLKDKTTLKVGGPAEYFVTVLSVAELKEAVVYAAEQGHEMSVLGGGSNLLVSDTGVKGLVIENQISGIDTTDTSADRVSYTVGAGVVFDDLVATTVSNGHWGLENLSHIPGSVGATPVQNVGAYGVEVKDYITEVHAVHTRTGEVRIFTTEECAFSYRDSFFKTREGRQYCITHVVFSLSTTPSPKLSYKDLATRFDAEATPNIEAIRNAIIDIRSHKFPDWRSVGTAGSFFKNPIILRTRYDALVEQYPNLPHYDVSDTEVKVPLGWILDKVCNLKGVREDVVGTYEGQALVLVQYGEATATDIDTFAKKIAKAVKEKTDVDIEREVTMW